MPGAPEVIQGGLCCGTGSVQDDCEGGSRVTSPEVVSDILSMATVLLAISPAPQSDLFLYSNYYYLTLNYIPFFTIAGLLWQNRSFLRAVTLFSLLLYPQYIELCVTQSR